MFYPGNGRVNQKGSVGEPEGVGEPSPNRNARTAV